MELIPISCVAEGKAADQKTLKQNCSRMRQLNLLNPVKSLRCLQTLTQTVVVNEACQESLQIHFVQDAVKSINTLLFKFGCMWVHGRAIKIFFPSQERMKRKYVPESQRETSPPEKKQQRVARIFEEADKLKLLRSLGTGTYSEVREYEHPQGKIAIKSMMCKHLEPRFVREAELLGLSHPQLLSMLDILPEEEETGETIHIGLPLATQSLADAMNDNKVQQLSLLQILGLIYQILCGINALHQVNILHADLKPANILVTSWPQKLDKVTLPKVVIGDPGLAVWVRAAGSEPSNRMFTSWYRPPEFLCRANEDESFQPTLKGDLFAVGVTIREILLWWIEEKRSFPPWLVFVAPGESNILDLETAQKFFQRYSGDSVAKWKKLCLTDWKFPRRESKRRRPETFLDLELKSKRLTNIEKDVLKQLSQLITSLLAFDPRDRPNALEALTEVARLYLLLPNSKEEKLFCSSLSMNDSWSVMNYLPVTLAQAQPNKVKFKEVKNSQVRKQLQQWYEWLVLHMGENFSVSRKQSLLLEFYRAAQALLTYKKNHPEFPDIQLPTLFYLYLVWIDPEEDHLFEEGLCDLNVNRPDFTQFLFDVLRNRKVLVQ